MASNKKYWRGFAELDDTQLADKLGAQREFPEGVPTRQFLENEELLDSTQTTRRDFLKFVGFSTAAATLAACEGPVIKSIPYVTKPDEITPGVPNYYATSLMHGDQFASVVVKTREGRPIKIEANKNTDFFGFPSPRMQGAILDLYNSQRLKSPLIKGENATWEELDAFTIKELQKAASTGQQIVILTPSYPSPTLKRLIADFVVKYPTAKHVVFDAVSHSAGIDAFEELTGFRALPLYDFSKAKLVVSFNADFLGDWNGGGNEPSYAIGRKPGKDMLRHIQVESNMTLSGSSADTRIPLKPTQVEKTLAEVYKGLTTGTQDKVAQEIVREIKQQGSKAVVIADGSKAAYSIAYSINQLMASQAFDSSKCIKLKESNDLAFTQFINNANEGKVGVLINFNVNPIYAASHLGASDAFKKIPLKISTNIEADETSFIAEVLAPGVHALESWGDANPVTGVYTLVQPTIRPLFKDTRQFEDSLLKWTMVAEEIVGLEAADAAKEGMTVEVLPQNYYTYLKNHWEKNILPNTEVDSFEKALFKGSVTVSEQENISLANADIASAIASILSIQSKGYELTLYTKVGIGDGTAFNNPWLQEFPDPITRTSWDNYLTMAYADAKELSLLNDNVMNGAMNGRLVNLTVNGYILKDVPVLVQPGQARGSLGLALGYGRGGKIAKAINQDKIGVDAYPFYLNFAKNQREVTFEKASGTHEFACIQLQNTLMGRDRILREVSLEDFINKSPEEWNEPEMLATHKGKEHVSKVDLWSSFDRSTGHYFNMSIDLTACTGCGACVISCTAENNVPVVGKHEIRVSRDMQWLRIDRYYSSETTFDEDAQKAENFSGLFETVGGFAALEVPADNPQVAFQPVMCQHCNHAPCESVCPVAATSHGKQGQNQMAYNRCVGTRYCANNCPYKVRRFNWFNYVANDKFDFNMNDDMGRMVLNPDVVVRSRGVMEKCSLCIQLTQATILKAKKEQRAVVDQEFQTACASVCPTGAIVFGDINDEKSEVRTMLKDKRQYYLLEQIGTRPNVFYQTKVRNNSNI